MSCLFYVLYVFLYLEKNNFKNLCYPNNFLSDDISVAYCCIPWHSGPQQWASWLPHALQLSQSRLCKCCHQSSQRISENTMNITFVFLKSSGEIIIVAVLVNWVVFCTKYLWYDWQGNAYWSAERPFHPIYADEASQVQLQSHFNTATSGSKWLGKGHARNVKEAQLP